jgi:lycopene cyclase domain-containing protein
MKEYTVLACLSVLAAVVLDHRTGIRVTRSRDFWIFMAIMMIFKCLVNGYLTGRPVVLYGDPFFLGSRLGSIPLEDFLYGFGLITFSIVCWELLLRRGIRRTSAAGGDR